MADWDYIIVGAGSAGCVLANRLSENPCHRVLLIEAGGKDSHPYIHIPRGHGKLLKDPRHAWFFSANDGPDSPTPPEIWIRGKVLGGSSSVNGMIYIHGQPEDYDDWERLGATGWGWRDMRPVFLKIEDHELGASRTRGVGGPLHVSVTRERSPLCDAVIAAARRIGIPEREDVNGEDQEGIGYTTQTVRNGRRVSAAKAFLKPALKRPNLHVVTDAEVRKILFQDRRAIGVSYLEKGVLKEASARGEVILSAGAIQSPLLLQRSGVGAGALLNGLGIPVVADNGGVGGNLREHRIVTLQFALASHRLSQNRDFAGYRLGLSAMRYLLTRRGPLASSFTDVVGFFKTEPGLDRPDAQLQLAPYSIDLDTAGTRGGEIEFHKAPGMSFLGCPLRPESRGEIRITSPDPAAPPHINPNYLADPKDRAVTLGIFRMLRRLAAEVGQSGLVGGEIFPGTGLADDDALIEHALRDGQCGYHTVGTCRMGSDEASVLDPQLRVRGVSGLRVVDCSVMPTMVSGNTNGPTMAVAWRAADIILCDAR